MKKQLYKTPFFLICLFLVSSTKADDAVYVEPGSLRLSHELIFENTLNRTVPGWRVSDTGVNKSFLKDPTSNSPWKAGWGQSLLTEVATRITPDFFGRVLFHGQLEYADRFWRPVNIEHRNDISDRHIFVKQAEARLDKDNWYIRGYEGVGHGDWYEQGDFFRLYAASYPDDNYLGGSGFFGSYPESYNQDFYQNISKRRIPRGFEGGAQFFGLETAAAYGRELQWGFSEGVFGRISLPLNTSKFTFVYQNQDVPTPFDDPDERNMAYSLSWYFPSDKGFNLQVGALYNPFRVGKTYLVSDKTSFGSGLGGSATQVSQKKSKKEDALAEKIRWESSFPVKNMVFDYNAEATHAGILAGNKNQIDLGFATNFVKTLRGSFSYTYRKPIEGPIPFLYQGTPNNIGAVLANPRGPESPFTVNWDNREAVFLTSTLVLDPTPGTSLFKYGSNDFSSWNISKDEDAFFILGFQHILSDYRTTTDRQYYYDEGGHIVWESAGRSGAWATKHPLHEFKVLLTGKIQQRRWFVGFAGGQSPAISGLAYTDNASTTKPLSEYYSFETSLDTKRMTTWAHFGSSVWGPERNTHRFFGLIYDRLFGGGVSYKLSLNTNIKISYLGARQDDSLFNNSDLGSFDEIRTLFTHRFGFLFQFENPSQPGYQAR
ncbi:MAG: hypothetical protein ACKVQC_09760 [Elusimicrobiota bacterium]